MLSSQPSSRNVLIDTASGRPTIPGQRVMRTPGSPVAGSGDRLPGAGNTQYTPVSSAIRFAETRSSVIRPAADASEYGGQWGGRLGCAWRVPFGHGLNRVGGRRHTVSRLLMVASMGKACKPKNAGSEEKIVLSPHSIARR